MQIFSLINQSVNSTLWKIAAQNVGCYFTYFCGGHKNSFRLHSRNSFKRRKCLFLAIVISVLGYLIVYRIRALVFLVRPPSKLEFYKKYPYVFFEVIIPANISTSDQRCFNVLDQRWNNVVDQRWNNVVDQRWNNVDPTLKMKQIRRRISNVT